MRREIIALTSILLHGCLTSPEFDDAYDSAASSFAGSSLDAVKTSTNNESITEDKWWTLLSDSKLDDLVERAIKGNLDLAAAQSKVKEARAIRRAAASGLLPSLTTALTGQDFELSQNAFGPNQFLADQGIPLDGRLYDASFDALWELDFFGVNRNSKNAADNRLAQTEATQRDILVSLAAEVSRNYVELRGTQKRLEVVKNNIRIQKDTLSLVQNRFNSGLASELDLARARAQLNNSEAQTPLLRTAERRSLYQLAVLLGEPPQALVDELKEISPIPNRAEPVPVGLPSGLLQRRNDIKAAQHALFAALAEQKVAQGNLYPRFFLTGSLGQESTSFSNLYSSASRAWSLGPLVQWPVFQGGALRAQRDASAARSEIAYANYQQAILNALAEVESQLVAYAEAQLRFESLKAATESATKSVELANVLYDRGLEDFLTVLDAERSLAQIEDQLIASETESTLQLVALFKALGGGWESFEDEKG